MSDLILLFSSFCFSASVPGNAMFQHGFSLGWICESLCSYTGTTPFFKMVFSSIIV
ncbi:unnamed protein product [Tetraodon nigroviridis]|uniref:Chromosome 8 SCAF14994, whole genome shotgun sequence n=1 Tax=Tetraodon nigroviridis TaxID=99883 RepID=Q4RUK5_TETNG|nr:unnamed protein product [Tetraodon nigroviridis]